MIRDIDLQAPTTPAITYSECYEQVFSHRFPYRWTLKDANFTKDKGRVFSCFACGGGILYVYLWHIKYIKMEQYKEIPFAENYLVSNFGNVKSKRYNKPLKGLVNNSGYKRVQIGSSKNKHFIHRLVAETFLEKTVDKDFVNHKDGNKLNNYAENLEWVTRSENDIHAFRNDLRKARKGEKHHNAILNEYDVKEIKTLLAKGFNCTYISELYSVHRKTINDIKLQKTWR